MHPKQCRFPLIPDLLRPMVNQRAVPGLDTRVPVPNFVVFQDSPRTPVEREFRIVFDLVFDHVFELELLRFFRTPPFERCILVWGDGALGEVELDLGEVGDSCGHHACFELDFELFELGVDLDRVVSIGEATTSGTGILTYLPLNRQPICVSSLSGDRRLAARTIKARNMTVSSCRGHPTCYEPV